MVSKKSYNVAIVGYGYWGPNLMRNFMQSVNFTVACLIDADPVVLESFKVSYPNIPGALSPDRVLEDESVDALVIATPPKSHYELTKRAVLKGKHIFIEKPFTTSFKEAAEILQLAEENKVEVFVDYTFLFHGAIGKIRRIVQDKAKFGELLYIDSVRINLGIFQSDVNVVWDLACHDIAIFNYLLNELPIAVQAIGIDGLGNGNENISYIHLKYKHRFAQINCSWSSPVKIRRMLIGGNRQAILYNDIEPTDKIKVYNKGVVFDTDDKRKEILQDYRTGEVYIPKYETTEALKNVVQGFYDSLTQAGEQRGDGQGALLTIFILEMIQKSILLGGKELEIDWRQVGPSLYSYITNKGMLNQP